MILLFVFQVMTNDTKANVILLSVKDEENGYQLLIDYFGNMLEL